MDSTGTGNSDGQTTGIMEVKRVQAPKPANNPKQVVSSGHLSVTSEKQKLLNDNQYTPKEEGQAQPFFKSRNGKICIIIAVILIAVVIGIIIAVVVSGGSAAACKPSGAHFCTCNGIQLPILIEDEDSVKLFNKTFTPAEIGRLKTKNGENNVTTFSIFKSIDKLTRACTLTNGTTQVSFQGESGTWVGSLKDGTPYGAGRVDFVDDIPGFFTYEAGQAEGFVIAIGQLQTEIRAGLWNGLGTSYDTGVEGQVQNSVFVNNQETFLSNVTSPTQYYWLPIGEAADLP